MNDHHKVRKNGGNFEVEELMGCIFFFIGKKKMMKSFDFGRKIKKKQRKRVKKKGTEQRV